MEIHTTDLTRECKRQRHLELQSLSVGFTTTALFRGNLGHGALETLHRDYDPADWDEDVGSECVCAGIKIAHQKAEEDKRPISAAVERDVLKIAGEVEVLVQHYIRRFKEYFSQCHLLGVEVPVRCTISVDGEPVEFASHIDLLFVGPEYWDAHSEFVVRPWDWKFKEQAPTREASERSLQMGSYGYSVANGRVLIGEEWQRLEADVARVAIVDMMRCLPYKQGGSSTSPDGSKRKYAKGDDRSLSRIIHQTTIDESGRKRWLSDFEDHVRMARAGLWPKSPDPIRCKLCDVQVHCEGYSDEQQSTDGAW